MAIIVSNYYHLILSKQKIMLKPVALINFRGLCNCLEYAVGLITHTVICI